ncbi:MAG: hypothetical protein ACTSVI_15125 [Promethearchaeota archaeon]
MITSTKSGVFKPTARSMKWSKFVVRTGCPAINLLARYRWMRFGSLPSESDRSSKYPMNSRSLSMQYRICSIRHSYRKSGMFRIDSTASAGDINRMIPSIN